MSKRTAAKIRAERAFAALLVDMFRVHEMRRFVESRDDALVGALPSDPVSPQRLAESAARELHNRGLLDDALFDALVEERPKRRADIEDVARLVHLPHPAPAPISPRRPRPGLIAGLAILLVLGAGLVVWEWWPEDPTRELPNKTPTPPPEGSPPASIPVVVLMYGDPVGGLTVPEPDDLVGSRLFLAERVLPEIVSSGPRAVFLDFTFAQLPGDDGAAALSALLDSIDAARELGVAVFAGRPRGALSAVAPCTEPGARRCVDDLLITRVSVDDDGRVRAVPMCDGMTMSMGYALARMAAEPELMPGTAVWTSGAVCNPEPPALQLPAGDACDWPWKRAWVSAVLTGEAYTGRDPASLESVAACAEPATLEGKLVIVGDGRAPEAGDQDRHTVVGADVALAVAGPELHALAGWSWSDLVD